MIEFTLSKLNLLIFVTAIAAIVMFFMNTVNSNLLTKQSFELIYKIGKEIEAGVNSKSYCSIKYLELPTYISTSGSNSVAHNLKYILNISSYKYPTTVDSNYENKLVLSVLNLKKNKIYSAYDIDYNGTFYLYNANYNLNSPDGYDFIPSNDQDVNEVNYDTLKSKSIDYRLIFVKKIKNSKAFYYIIPCAKVVGYPKCKDFMCDETNGLIITENLECLNIVPDLCTVP